LRRVIPTLCPCGMRIQPVRRGGKPRLFRPIASRRPRSPVRWCPAGGVPAGDQPHPHTRSGCSPLGDFALGETCMRRRPWILLS
jgi:hypothetical protein